MELLLPIPNIRASTKTSSSRPPLSISRRSPASPCRKTLITPGVSILAPNSAPKASLPSSPRKSRLLTRLSSPRSTRTATEPPASVSPNSPCLSRLTPAGTSATPGLEPPIKSKAWSAASFRSENQIRPRCIPRSSPQHRRTLQVPGRISVQSRVRRKALSRPAPPPRKRYRANQRKSLRPLGLGHKIKLTANGRGAPYTRHIQKTLNKGYILDTLLAYAFALVLRSPFCINSCEKSTENVRY